MLLVLVVDGAHGSMGDFEQSHTPNTHQAGLTVKEPLLAVLVVARADDVLWAEC